LGRHIAKIQLVTLEVEAVDTQDSGIFVIRINYLPLEDESSARSTVAGTGCETVSSLPFGDGETITSTCSPADPSPMHFTGKERDTESGLDNFGARYNSSSMGRFMSPDAFTYALKSDPQTWNLYSYDHELSRGARDCRNRTKSDRCAEVNPKEEIDNEVASLI
jgi:RHS repeat-associated protein